MIENCSVCEKAYQSSCLTEFDGEYLCPSCLSEETTVCRQCGRRIWSRVRGKDSQDVLCNICRGDVFTTCQMCGSPVLWKSVFYVEEDVRHECPLCWVCCSKSGV